MKTKKILIIEDEEYVAEDLKILLEEEGYSAVIANNGKDGISYAREESPDLIICDIMMEGTDGYEVLEAVSRMKGARLIPFIFLTAKVERDDIRKGMQLGADDYLFKPFRAEELLIAIETRLKKLELLKADLDTEKQNDRTPYHYSDKIFVKISGQMNIIKVSEILYISAENQYSSIHIIGGKSFLIRRSISAWEKLLPTKEFLRIHRSTIINSEFIVKMSKWDNNSFVVHLEKIEHPFIISKRYSSRIRKISL